MKLSKLFVITDLLTMADDLPNIFDFLKSFLLGLILLVIVVFCERSMTAHNNFYPINAEDNDEEFPQVDEENEAGLMFEDQSSQDDEDYGTQTETESDSHGEEAESLNDILGDEFYTEKFFLSFV